MYGLILARIWINRIYGVVANLTRGQLKKWETYFL